jgi:hypothetical protein
VLFLVVLLALEPFEAQDQDLGRFVYLHLLLGPHVLFAFGAIPGVVFGQGLRLLKELEAVMDACLRIFTIRLLLFISLARLVLFEPVF